jgi:hypothetical protein
VAMAAYGATAYISTMYYDTNSATTSCYAIHVIQSQYPISQSHLKKPWLNRRRHLCTAGADASPPPQPLYLHLVHHAYTVD